MEGEVVFAFVDILGPCRELFGNLLSDFVETLAFVRDFPGARFVEPSIANAVWRRFKPSQQEVSLAKHRDNCFLDGSSQVFSFVRFRTSGLLSTFF